jgi:hypothetical protein
MPSLSPSRSYLVVLREGSFLQLSLLDPRIRGGGSGWTIGIRLPAGAVMLLFATASRPALWSTQPRIQCVPWALFSGVKRMGREADHSPISSDEIKNDWTYISTPSIRLHGLLRNKHQGQFCCLIKKPKQGL